MPFCSLADGMFTIDPDTGRVKTARATYEDGKKYEVHIQAVDMDSKSRPDVRRSEVAILDIRGGSRPPQFFLPEYRISVPEDMEVSRRLQKELIRVLWPT